MDKKVCAVIVVVVAALILTISLVASSLKKLSSKEGMHNHVPLFTIVDVNE